MALPKLGLMALPVAIALWISGCSDSCDDCDEEEPMSEPLFPADYAASYTEVRNCRPSADHDLMMVRMLADPTALDAYETREEPFPEGSIVLKEEYDFGDDNCEGEIQQWSVMEKLAPGSSDDTLDWSWQRVDSERQVVAVETTRCVGCHTACGVAPDGHDGTCAVP